VLQELQHLARILTFVSLGSKGPNCGTPAGSENPFLQCCGIGQSADHTSEGINLMDQLAFGWAPYGGVAGLPRDAIDIEAKESG
jgi:hypothetical protein